MKYTVPNDDLSKLDELQKAIDTKLAAVASRRLTGTCLATSAAHLSYRYRMVSIIFSCFSSGT